MHMCISLNGYPFLGAGRAVSRRPPPITDVD